MKDAELKLVSELMKNSRRSDRELAKAIGVSQSTVSRTIKRLEKEGVLKEYTMIPDFAKLGFEMMSITLAKTKEEVSIEELRKIRQQLAQTLKEPLTTILSLSGVGLDSDRVLIALHENYAAYTRFLDIVKHHPLAATRQINIFLMDLTAKSQNRSLTLSGLADYINFKLEKNREKP
jgi:DNA-binding Lrp family transcriptional regulator